MATPIDILEKIEDTIEAVDGIVDGQVKIGIMWPAQGSEHQTYINIVPVRSKPIEIDGFDATANFDVLVVGITRLDGSSAIAEIKQLLTIWNPIEKAMEDLIKNNCDGLANKMFMDPSGIDWAGFDDKSTHAIIAAIYTSEIEYSLGTE